MNAPSAGDEALDRAMVRALQGGLPRVARPYHAIAEALGVSPQTVMARVNAMLASGAIRRIGAVPNHYRLGWTANGMSVWDVDDAVVDALGVNVGALDCVSHCYRRPRRPPAWPYNLFAMVHGRSRDEVAAKVVEIAAVLGPHARAHDVLFSTRILKKTGLRFGATAPGVKACIPTGGPAHSPVAGSD
jgi:siroheme decarboxylase